MRTTTFVALAAAVMLIGVQPVMAQSGHDLFQQALVKERADGQLREAIALYERIVREFSADRELAANALLRVGRCYETLGNSEAQRAYQRVVDEYADQATMVAEARGRLRALRRPLEDAEVSTIVVRRVPGNPGFLDGGPAPDGRRFAYIDYSTGDVALWNLVTGEGQRLTRDGSWEPPEQYAINVSISPDGQTAAYTWSMHDSVIELRVAGLNGSAPRRLCSNTDGVGYPMSWSTDGRHIAVPIYDSAAGSGGVAWVSVQDGSMRQLTTLPAWEWLTLSHSPDDAFVAMAYSVKEDSGRSDIFLVATDGSGVIPLVNHPANDRLLGWLPDTEHVLFLSDRSGGWDVWTIQVAGGRASGEPRVVRRGIGNVDPLGFTSDGSLFYSISTYGYTTSIAPFDAITGQIDIAASEPLLGSRAAALWSPGGEHLVFLRMGDPSSGRPELSLGVRNMATGEERVLADHIDPDKPRWYPDAESVLVAGRERDRPRGGSALYRIDVATGDALPVLEFMPDPSWWTLGNAFHMGIGGTLSRDGDRLVYIHNGRLVNRHLPSGRETELYHDPGLATRILAMSPNGAELVFAVNDSTNALWSHPMTKVYNAGRLMAVSLEGGEVRELTKLSGPGTMSSVAWMPDGRHLLFFRERGEGGAVLWRVSRQGGDAERVWETELEVLGFALSPDGSQVAYWTMEIGSEIWVMENLKAVLQRRE